MSTATAMSLRQVPYRMDASNQAGWWKPIDEFGGALYLAYNGFGGPGSLGGGASDTHTVYVARRGADGAWTRGCVHDNTGACAIFRDDAGHKQSSVSVDGDGYIHVFASMHWNHWIYYRSTLPGDVTTLVGHSAELPDQAETFAYPITARAADGDVYLIIRAAATGRLYHWDHTGHSWSAVATFAAQANYTVYPDDLIPDSTGNMHLAWEWSFHHPARGPRHLGSYLRYSPASNTFSNAGGAAVTVPATTASPVVYKPVEGTESQTGVDSPATPNPPGMETAKLALDGTTSHPVLAYRFRSTAGGAWQIRVARWTGTAWVRGIVYAGTYSTSATEDVSIRGSSVRIYYAKAATKTGDQLFVATRRVGTSWTGRGLAPGVRIERLAVIRSTGSDLLYLAVPSTRTLYLGGLRW